jgi:hypothetical protein
MDDLSADAVWNPFFYNSKSYKSHPGNCQKKGNNESGEVIM